MSAQSNGMTSHPFDLLAAAEARVFGAESWAAMNCESEALRNHRKAQLASFIAERDALRALIDAAQTVVDEYEHRFGTGDGFFGPIDPAVMALRAALSTNAQGEGK